MHEIALIALIHKTAFNTPTGYYKYQVMPFRLVNAWDKNPAVKQLQRFLGFAHFYRWSNKKTSTIAEPLYYF